MQSIKKYIQEDYSLPPTKRDYFLVLLLILFSSNANPIFRDEPLMFSIIPIFISFYYFSKMFIFNRGLLFGQKSILVYVVFGLYILSYLIKYNGEFDPGFSYRIFKYISLSFLIIQVVDYKFFKIYEKIIYSFAIISLPFFLLEVVIYDVLFSIMKSIQNILMIPPHEYANYANILIFTVNRGNEVGNVRNCGFTWEPGAFANFLILAIIINLISNNFNLRNKKLITMMIALMTTFSTAGFLALFLLSFFYLANVPFVKTLLLLPIVIITFIYVSTLPFMTEKIVDYAENAEKDLSYYSWLAEATGNKYTLGRFAGLLMNWEDIKEHPVIGYGGHGEYTYSTKRRIIIYSINGLGKWTAQYGIIGLLIFLFTWMKSFTNLSQLYGFKKPIFLLFIVFVLGFSFNLIQSPLFFGFQFSFLFLPSYGVNLKNEIDVNS